MKKMLAIALIGLSSLMAESAVDRAIKERDTEGFREAIAHLSPRGIKGTMKKVSELAKEGHWCSLEMASALMERWRESPVGSPKWIAHRAPQKCYTKIMATGTDKQTIMQQLMQRHQLFEQLEKILGDYE